MVSHSSADWQSLTRCILVFGVAVTMGLFLMTWETGAAPSEPDSASSPPSPVGPSPNQPGQQRGGRSTEAMQHMRQACAADVKNFCAQVKPGGGRIVECLEDHSKEISDECYDLLEKRAERQKKGAQ
ncbi:MAG TPA: cysteine rich repeat-containing protein [Nitrospiraceae bacterium]|nr:cysteine rich repeat-containing protein [Nitrospiraceae bacterium]